IGRPPLGPRPLLVAAGQGHYRSQRHLPEAAAGLETDRDQRAERRWRARHPRRRQQHAPAHDVGRAAHEVVLVVVAEPLFGGAHAGQIESVTRDQLDHRSEPVDRKSTRLNSSHVANSYAVFCLKKKNTNNVHVQDNRDGGKTWNNVAPKVPGVPKDTYVSRVAPDKHVYSEYL